VKSFILDDVLRAQPALIVIAAGLQDPGNLGTIARSAEAFGATGMLLGDGTVSQRNWKALRASAGSMFRVPAVKVELASAIRELKARGLGVLATSSHKGTPISQADLRRPMAVLVGNEGSGAPKGVLSQADEIVAIPQSSRVESLNAGMPHRSFSLRSRPAKESFTRQTQKRRGIEF
jgi:TrmH family RNA methyltransferase